MTIPTGYAQATYNFSGAGMPTGGAITMGFDIAGYGGTPDLMAPILGDLYETHINPLATNVTQVASVLVKFGPDATGPSAVASGPWVGNASTSPASPAVSFLIRKNTALGGRAGRGRIYMPGVNEAVIDQAGVIAPLSVTALTDAWEAMKDAWEGLGWFPVLLHQPGSPLTTPTPITSFAAQGVVATQRRRQRR